MRGGQTLDAPSGGCTEAKLPKWRCVLLILGEIHFSCSLAVSNLSFTLDGGYAINIKFISTDIV